MKDEDVENILLEILRLFPPFFGCFRVATNDFDLGEFHVPKGSAHFSKKPHLTIYRKLGIQKSNNETISTTKAFDN